MAIRNRFLKLTAMIKHHFNYLPLLHFLENKIKHNKSYLFVIRKSTLMRLIFPAHFCICTVLQHFLFNSCSNYFNIFLILFLLLVSILFFIPMIIWSFKYIYIYIHTYIYIYIPLYSFYIQLYLHLFLFRL